jgi:hypothetical protein
LPPSCFLCRVSCFLSSFRRYEHQQPEGKGREGKGSGGEGRGSGPKQLRYI